MGKWWEKGRRPFWAPTRGRKVNIYCLPFSSFKFRKYLLFITPSCYFHCFCELRTITVNHFRDALVYTENKTGKPGLSWLFSEVMQYTETNTLLLWYWLLTLLDFLLVAEPGRVLLFSCEELELSSSSSSSSSSKFMLLEMPEEKAAPYEILTHWICPYVMQNTIYAVAPLGLQVREGVCVGGGRYMRRCTNNTWLRQHLHEKPTHFSKWERK